MQIRTPKQVAPLPAQIVPSAQTTAAELAVEAQRAAKLTAFASLMVLVYPGPVSAITWTQGERTFHAYSSIDFRLLRGVSEVETDTVVASWFCFPMEALDSELAAELRDQLHLTPSFAEYVVDATDEEMAAAPEAFVVLDAIHAFFDANRAQLAAAHEKLLAEDVAREAAAKANPPVQPDTTVYLWQVNSGAPSR